MEYNLLNKQILELIKDVPYTISNLANVTAFLFDSLDDINWLGFYLVKDESLILGPFQGKVACVKLEKNKGVCGTSFALNQTLVVNNVHEFPGHIACDSNSKSELVIPIHKNNKVIGVLDIDSPIYNRFSLEDEEGLENIVKTLESYI